MLRDEQRREQAQARQRERLMDLARVLELDEGRRVLARLLWELGMGRVTAEADIMALNLAQRLFERMRSASPAAARQVLALVYGFME